MVEHVDKVAEEGAEEEAEEGDGEEYNEVHIWRLVNTQWLSEEAEALWGSPFILTLVKCDVTNLHLWN